MQTVDTVIVGDGISAKCVIFALNKIGLTDILQISSDDQAPSCSTRTTAINCLRGTKKGLSPLGDLIVDSFHDFEHFFNEHKPEGVCKTYEWQCWPQDSKDHAKWVKRFKTFYQESLFTCFKKNFEQVLNFTKSKAYIFSPEIFYRWMAEQSKFTKKDDFVTEIFPAQSGYQVKTLTGYNVKTKRIIFCTSYMTPHFSHFVQDQKLKKELEHSKPVTGTYLRFQKNDFNVQEISFQESFSFVINEIHFIYRKQSQDILIGATTTNDSMVLLADKEGILDQYTRLASFFEGAITLPPFEQGELITGIRHKGQRRTPFWGEINHNMYAIWGLYKNAFTLAFTASNDVTELIQK